MNNSSAVLNNVKNIKKKKKKLILNSTKETKIAKDTNENMLYELEKKLRHKLLKVWTNILVKKGKNIYTSHHNTIIKRNFTFWKKKLIFLFLLAKIVKF